MNTIYLATNTVTGKKYVGKTCKPAAKRWAEHKSAAKRGTKTHLYDSIRKHGAGVFEIEELARTPHDSFASWLEQFFIRQLNTTKPEVGYNLTSGGEGCRATESVKSRIRSALKARVAAGIHKMPSNSPRGRPKGFVVSEETRRKSSLAQRGRKLTDDHKKKLSQAKIGRPSPNTGVYRRADISDHEIVSQYQSGKSLRAIAAQLGAKKETIRWRLRRLNIKLRPVGAPPRKRENSHR